MERDRVEDRRVAPRVRGGSPGGLPAALGLLAALLLVDAIAPRPGCGDPAGQAGEFLRYGVGARALALGHAFTAIADDATALYWNPAGIAQLDRGQLDLSYTRVAEDAGLTFAGYVHPLGQPTAAASARWDLRHTVGVSYLQLSSGDLEGRDAAGAPTGLFSDQQFAVSGAYALSLARDWGVVDLGTRLTWIRHDQAELSGSGWGGGVSGLFQPHVPPQVLSFVPLRYVMPWRVGLDLEGLGSLNLVDGGQGDDLPGSLSIGVSNAAVEELVGLRRRPLKLLLTYDYQRIFGARSEHYLGGEFGYLTGGMHLALRFGVHLNADDGEPRITWGLGVTGLGLGGEARASRPLSLTASYAQAASDALSDAKTVSLSLTHGARRHSLPSAQAGRMARGDLARTLADYSSDVRLEQEWNVLDRDYRKVIAQALLEHAEVDGRQRIIESYKRFIGGIHLADARAEEALRDFQLCALDPGASAATSARLDTARMKYETRSLVSWGELTDSPCSAERYVELQLARGATRGMGQSRRESLQRLIGSGRLPLPPERRQLYLALLTRDACGDGAAAGCGAVTTHLRRFLAEPQATGEPSADPDDSRCLRDYARFLLAIFEDDANALDAVSGNWPLRCDGRTTCANPARPGSELTVAPAPYICDGTLVDDVIFARTCMRMDELEWSKVRRELIGLALDYPHTNLGVKLASLGPELQRADREWLAELWQAYRRKLTTLEVKRIDYR